jgi:hypothetical protein
MQRKNETTKLKKVSKHDCTTERWKRRKGPQTFETERKPVRQRREILSRCTANAYTIS